MKNLIVAPSILSADFAEMGKAVEDIKAWGAEYVHCDVMDGVYVPNLTFGMPMVKALRKRTDLIIDAHLMITEPQKYAAQFCDSGADIVTIHPDACANQKDVLTTIESIKAMGRRVGIAVNANVDVAFATHYFQFADLVLIMTVQAGFGGQSFKRDCLQKVADVARLRNENAWKYLIEVDGGVDCSNISLLKEAGVDIAVAGSAIFKSPDPKEVVRIFHNA